MSFCALQLSKPYQVQALLCESFSLRVESSDSHNVLLPGELGAALGSRIVKASTGPRGLEPLEWASWGLWTLIWIFWFYVYFRCDILIPFLTSISGVVVANRREVALTDRGSLHVLYKMSGSHLLLGAWNRPFRKDDQKPQTSCSSCRRWRCVGSLTVDNPACQSAP
jgi:hypothetical protein